MSIKITSKNPKAIIDKFDKLLIREEGNISSWSGNQKDGYKHESPNFEAKVKAVIKEDALLFKFTNWKDSRSYSEYHGYLITTLLEYFKNIKEYTIVSTVER